jgi:hypothetical protein
MAKKRDLGVLDLTRQDSLVRWVRLNCWVCLIPVVDSNATMSIYTSQIRTSIQVRALDNLRLCKPTGCDCSRGIRAKQYSWHYFHLPEKYILIMHNRAEVTSIGLGLPPKGYKIHFTS